MPHAVMVELDWDGGGGSAAYAGELPGCAVFAATPEEAVASIPGRVADFVSWLEKHGESLRSFVGGNWYEVERVAARRTDGGATRAAFSLDELPLSDDEFARYVGWLELAREELAEALDRTDADRAAPLIEPLVAQDGAFAASLGGTAPEASSNPLDGLFTARDALSDALSAAGAGAPSARGVLRIAIADDLRVADGLRALARA